MTIGIDIRVLARGTRTGIEEYTINLLSHLLPLEPKINFKLFYNAYQKIDLDYPWINLPNVELKDFRIPNRLFFASAGYLNQPKIDKLLGDIDIYFNPHFFAAPLSPRLKKVVTFHDLSFEHHPCFFSWRKRLWQKFLMNTRKEAQKADRIIAVSKSTKEDLINFYKIEPQKIKVIYSGLGERFLNNKKENQEEKIESIKKKYNLPDRFILYFGTIEPRKNIIGLIKAFAILRKKHSLKLVVAGAQGWLEKDIFRAARESEFRNDIIFPGFIEEEDKPVLYNLAELFIYPSFFEGFGFPPLEAMACGLPTIVSHSSSLSEVVGRGALMVNPYHIDELAWAARTILEDQRLRENLISEGRRQIRKFSWQRCAVKTLEVLKNDNWN